MDRGAKLLGHHVHPILIVFPLGLLSTAAIFELIYYVAGGPTFNSLAYWMLLSGVIGGVAAAVFGFIDWLAIPSGTRAKRVGLAHGAANAAALLLFAFSWYLRPGPLAASGTARIFLYVYGPRIGSCRRLAGWRTCRAAGRRRASGG